MSTQFRNIDTRLADGIYIRMDRIETFDDTASPLDWMDENEDRERIQAWREGDWHFIGIQARAEITIIRNGYGIMHELTSGGLWSIESDSGDEYLDEVFREECDALKADIAAFASLPINYR